MTGNLKIRAGEEILKFGVSPSLRCAAILNSAGEWKFVYKSTVMCWSIC